MHGFLMDGHIILWYCMLYVCGMTHMILMPNIIQLCAMYILVVIPMSLAKLVESAQNIVQWF